LSLCGCHTWQMVLDVITGVPLSAEYDSFATILAFSNSLVNPILLVYLDGAIKVAVFGLMGISPRLPHSPKETPYPKAFSREATVLLA